ncbi:MAG: DUF4625 domain-containing protein [Agriterribacter sp.]
MKDKQFLKSMIMVWYIPIVLFSSCSKESEKEKPAAPTIEVVHLGAHISSGEDVFYLGQEGHFEVNIAAPGRIRSIELEIDQKSGYATFSLTKNYTDYVGKKEVLGFQDYPLIPEGEAIGDYTFHLKVTDQAGQVGKLERDITVAAGDSTNTGHEHEGH